MTGTGLSQVITIGVTVILTRIYTPEHFGLFALFMSVFSISGNPATGKYDKAILLPKEEEESILITMTSIGLAFIYAIFILVVFFFFRYSIAEQLDDLRLAPWLLLVPVFIVINSSSTSLIVWLNRHKKYPALAKSRVLKSVVTAVVNIGFALIISSTGGLIFGELFGMFGMATFLWFVCWKENFITRLKMSKIKIKELLYRYRNFPKFNVLSDLLNIVSAQLPVVLLTSFFGIATVGFYSLTKRVLDAPMNLMSGAIMEVFRQKAAADYYEKGNCTDILLSTVKKLAMVSLIPFTIFFFLAPWIFEIVFGPEWRIAGEIARVLSLMYVSKFIFSPITYVFYIADKQKEDFLLHIYMLSTTFLSLYLGYVFSSDLIYTFLFFSINYFFIYLIYGFRSYIHSKGSIIAE